ncbi:BspA family leucine-rich repeat surface protein [Mycoplasmopsis agalactiae]|nr:BspA family leucine-rich repeat surface protein [Mycoplasmopsis agalactiae]KAB6718394.1 BspA family leucine-rich repeat surface protein [Mycoplasmopsis agalactiae]
MPSDEPNNTYTIPMNNDEEKQRRIEEEKQKKLDEERKQQEQEDKNNVELLKKIIEEQKDAFGSFHTQKEFVDQINVYAKDKNINGLTLQNKEDENKSLNEDTDGGKNNKIKLQLGSQKFETQLGIVLKDAVLTKYYFDDGTENPEIKSNILDSKRGIEKNWTPVNNTGKSVVITQLGYFKDRGTIKLTGSPHNTSKVPSKLPLKVDSLYLSFYNLKSSKVDNIDNWDTSNIKNAEQAFYYAQNFNQDLSRWKVTNINNMKQMFSNAKSYSYSLDGWKIKSGVNTNKIFENAPKMKQHFEKIASAWSIDKSKLS